MFFYHQKYGLVRKLLIISLFYKAKKKSMESVCKMKDSIEIGFEKTFGTQAEKCLGYPIVYLMQIMIKAIL